MESNKWVYLVNADITTKFDKQQKRRAKSVKPGIWLISSKNQVHVIYIRVLNHDTTC